MIEVLEPGLMTTVQDLGRVGLGRLGVPMGGAADRWSLRVANMLAGNSPGAAGLEVTASGPRLRTTDDTIVAIAGADLGATITGRRVAPGTAAVLPAGEELHLPGPPVGALRTYVAIAGGIDVPAVLGSRSTCRSGAFGGLAGRVLEAGDRVSVGAGAARQDVQAVWPGRPIAPCRTGSDREILLRCRPGPVASEGHEALIARSWTVSPASDRMGLRLDAAGSAMAAPPALPSHGVVPGTVQLPPDGCPIILGPDHQTTGGYPVMAVVIAADLPALGQVPPLAKLRFEAVELRDARAALRDQRREWEEALDLLRRDAAWDELARSAGA